MQQIEVRAYIERFLSQKNYKEMIRFVLVGIMATLIHYGIYIFLNRWIETTIAYTIGYVISFLGNFYLSNRYTFGTVPSFKKGLGFAGSHLFNYLFQITLLHLCIKIGVPSQLAPIPVYCVTVPSNFVIVRFVLKRK